MTDRLFAVICPTFGAKFAFNAADEKEANHLMSAWNSYHSFRGADVRHTAREISKEELTNLCISIHNEYISFLA